MDSQAERKERILEAARQVIKRVGYNNASTREIANEANVNLAMLNYYFGGKEPLLNETLAYAGRLAVAALQEAIGEPENITQLLERGLASIWQQAQDVPELQPYELLLRAPYDKTGEARKQSLLMYQNYRALVVEAASKAMEHSGERLAIELEDFAYLVVSSVDGIVLNYRVTDDKVRAETGLRSLQQALLGLVIKNDYLASQTII
jgi:AcrR family transcriptional regulator